ncbi:Hypothetical protein EIN_382660, partial [Entamoeba invadens IP1]
MGTHKQWLKNGLPSKNTRGKYFVKLVVKQ